MIWIFDVVLCVLLLGVIIVGTQLWRKIDIIKQSQGELQNLLKQLNLASEQAHHAIFQLRAVLKEADSKLDDRLKRARALSDELSIITESGDRLAHRLTETITDAPQAQKTKMRRGMTDASSGPKMKSGTDSKDIDDLTRILQGLR